MFEKILGNITGIEIYPIVSLVIFFIIFIVIVYRTIRADRGIIKKMKNLPLEPDKSPKKFGE